MSFKKFPVITYADVEAFDQKLKNKFDKNSKFSIQLYSVGTGMVHGEIICNDPTCGTAYEANGSVQEIFHKFADFIDEHNYD